jgi:phosphoenolpyruvate carboxykinase (GTP)
LNLHQKLSLPDLQNWIENVTKLTQPNKIYLCDGSEAEYQNLINEMQETEDLIKLNSDKYPNCYLHRSDPSDVARVEHLTYICSNNKDDAGPNNNWMDPKEAHSKMDLLFKNSMKNRTMYIIPYCMGPIDSPYSRCGIEITDSPYVVINMKLMTRMGQSALNRILKEKEYVKGLHSIGKLDPNERFIMHFPDELSIKSFGSGYGGNALLGKKCHALRIASWQAKNEGWLAEHMLIVGIEDPKGNIKYIACAFPSACGKTNLAMLIPPKSQPGWKIWTLGDDIAWLHLDDSGEMRAINPEAGYFGVVPGTNERTNKNAFDMIHKDTIYTNVGLTEDNEPWWENKNTGIPTKDWQGNIYKAENGVAAHQNSRFTVSAKNNPSYSSLAEAPEGVQISAIVFGGRRKKLAPLVYEAKNWKHGVFIGAGIASETTAAATGKKGILRRDPMAMLPFCGYNFADYWSHWLSFERKTEKLPKIFHVNWFRQNDKGMFLWPGFNENLRVLRWIIDRCEEKIDAQETPIGFLPHRDDIDMNGLDIPNKNIDELLSVDEKEWLNEIQSIGEYIQNFGQRVPKELLDQFKKLEIELSKSST